MSSEHLQSLIQGAQQCIQAGVENIAMDDEVGIYSPSELSASPGAIAALGFASEEFRYFVIYPDKVTSEQGDTLSDAEVLNLLTRFQTYLSDLERH